MLRRLGVKTFQAESADDVEGGEAIALELNGTDVTCIISLRKLVVAGYEDGNVRIFDRDAVSTARAVFAKHKDGIEGMAQLDDDLIVSMDDSQIFTWQPSTTKVIGSWGGDEESINAGGMTALAKLDEERLVVGNCDGDMLVLSHICGTELKLVKRFRRKHNDYIGRILVGNNVVVSYPLLGRTAKVWSKSELNHLATLRARNVNDVAISSTHIVMAFSEGRIRVHHSTPPYALQFVLQIPDHILKTVICLNADIVAVGGSSGCVSFVSLSKKSVVARVKVSMHWLTYLAVLRDKRIAAADKKGVCTLFDPPDQVEDAVNDYISDVYSSTTLSSTSRPILGAWHSVQQNSLSVLDACKTVIKSEYTSQSLDEWCVAHSLLMEAVNTGVVPHSRDYSGTARHWHIELYQHCDKLAIGEKEIGFLVSLFDEAERAGVVAEGTSESFIYAVRIRKDIHEESWYSANAIYRLFLRQAETDERLQRVLHYQKVQQLTSVVNAVLGVVPIGGAIATNAVSGGAAILNDFQICGLVESLMSSGKDLSGGFGSDKLVDMFFRRGNEVLSEDHWDEWGEGNRKAVEDAARNLGLSVKELRVRLLRAAEMMNDGQTSNQDENLTDDVVVVEEEEIEGYVEGDKCVTEAANTPGLDQLNHEVSEANMEVEGAQVEMSEWANKSLNKQSLENLDEEEVASCLAAFLLKYSKRRVGTYIRLKHALLAVFDQHFIDGLSFVHADDKHREELNQAIMSAIAKEVEGLGNRNLGIRLKLFLQKGLES